MILRGSDLFDPSPSTGPGHPLLPFGQFTLSGCRPFHAMDPAFLYKTNRCICPFNRASAEVGVEGCEDQIPVGSFHSEADGIVFYRNSTFRGLGCPQRRFGYFVAVDKVTRVGTRNNPQILFIYIPSPPCTKKRRTSMKCGVPSSVTGPPRGSHAPRRPSSWT